MKTKMKLGFTLIETMILVAIIGLLAGMVITAIMENRAETKMAAKKEQDREWAVMHEIAKYGTDVAEPIDLGDNWYYLGHKAVQAGMLKVMPPPDSANVSGVSYFWANNLKRGNIGTGGIAIVNAAEQLGVTNGIFVHVEYAVDDK